MNYVDSNDVWNYSINSIVSMDNWS